MPGKPYTYNRLVLGGPTARGGQWSIGLAAQTSAAMSNEALEAWLEGVAPDIRLTYSTTGGAKWGGLAALGTKLSYLAAYHYNANSGTASFQARYDGFTPQGGEGTGQAPSYAACCVSLIGNGAGRHNRGRVYCPADAAALSNHQIAAADVSTVVSGVRDLIDRLNGSTIAGEDVTIGIAAAATFVPVSRVRADSLLDTQRPRADREPADATHSDNV